MTNKPEVSVKKRGAGLSSKHVLLILGGLVIVCAAVIVAIILLKPEETVIEPPTVAGTNRVITPETVNEINLDIEEKVAKGMFETYMNTTWTFPDGKSPSSDAIMGNSPNNNYDFYFTLTISATGEIVFTSGLIPVGTEISEIVLDKELAAGTYDAVVGIYMVDENGDDVDSNMGINVTLDIKS